LEDLAVTEVVQKIAAEPKRNQAEARRVARLHYSHPGCCLCGQTVGEQIAHLDHNPANNDPDNLARLCHHHHWMYDIGLFSLSALKLQRAHWELTKGKPTNAFMKDAGRKAAVTRAAKGIGSEMALKAVATSRAHAKAAA
jgi:predicted restriction endonuclease